MATRIVNQTRGNVVCERTEVAANMFTRMRGLLGRAGLADGEGMFFRNESSLHSAFMRFDFDAVFMDRDMRVVKTVERIPPWRAQRARGTRHILELSAGAIARSGVQVGDQLAVLEDGDDGTA